MLLGQVLEEVSRDPDPLELLAEDLDLVALAQAGALAEAAEGRLSDVLRAAIDSFLSGASEEDWMQLVGKLQEGEASAAACVNLMLRRYLRETSTHGSGC